MQVHDWAHSSFNRNQAGKWNYLTGKLVQKALYVWHFQFTVTQGESTLTMSIIHHWIPGTPSKEKEATITDIELPEPVHIQLHRPTKMIIW